MNRSQWAIATSGLTRRFGKKEAVSNLNLKVPAGSVFAFLGRNGAGKTTTIRILLNLLDKTSGGVSVLGMDPAKNGLELKRRVGYVAEGQQMYDWMTVDEIIWFCKGFYSTWDDTFATDLKRRLELNGGTRLGELSRGGQGRCALLLALAFHPELLILDEPTAGLDPVVRRQFMEGVIELIQEQGRTVFFSSHLVGEVERVADWVAIIEEGHLLTAAPIEELKSRVKNLIVSFEHVPPGLEIMPGLLKCERNGRQALLTVNGFSDETLGTLQAFHPTNVSVMDLSLEGIFVSLVGGGKQDVTLV